MWPTSSGAIEILEVFMTDTAEGQCFKTTAFKRHGDLSVYLQGKELDIANEVKVLGVAFQFANSNFLLTLPDDKVEKSGRASSPDTVLRYALSLEKHAKTGCWVLPKVFYGIEVQDVLAEKERRLRTQ